MQRAAFEKLIDESFALLPERIRERISNVAILVEDEPNAEVRGKEELAEDETLLGYYHGIPLAERGSDYGVGMTLPDTITLYQLPIEDEADESPEEVRRVIAETLWHEVAHHFGMDEGEVRSKERARGRRRGR
ncbi:MAG: metallopeptidase family protein [bacterium]|nr:metallopeptidase family protein [bacterium]